MVHTPAPASLSLGLNSHSKPINNIVEIMKKLIIGTLCSALTLFSACDLDKFPTDSIAQGEAWQTLDDAENFRNGIYSYLQVVSGGRNVYPQEFQSDLYNALAGFGNNYGDMHRWNFTASQYDIEYIWQYNYVCINNCNNIINNIDNIALADADEQAQANNIKGEAYLMRAYCYHTLALRFAKDYDPATAASDLGLPLVLVGDPNGKPARATLEETYQQIKSDIAQARQLMTAAGEANSYYFTTDVIDALEARVDLYMHNYSEAISLSQGIIAKYPLASTVDDLKNVFLVDAGSEVLMRVFMSTDDRTNEMADFLSFNTASGENGAYDPYFVPSQWVIDLYEDSDIRKQVYFLQDDLVTNGIEGHDIYMLNKFPGNPDLKLTTYEYYNMWKPFRSAESYLVVAEAAYLNGDESTSLNVLNQLRTQRGASALSVNGGALFQSIKDEWIREYIGEGQRLEGLKRWGDGFTRHDPQDETILSTGTGMETLSVTSDDIRFVWEIPANDQNANQNLEPNWD